MRVMEDRIVQELDQVFAGKITQAEAARRIGFSRQAMNHHYIKWRARRAAAARQAQEREKAAAAKKNIGDVRYRQVFFEGGSATPPK